MGTVVILIGGLCIVGVIIAAAWEGRGKECPACLGSCEYQGRICNRCGGVGRIYEVR